MLSLELEEVLQISDQEICAPVLFMCITDVEDL